MGMAERPSRSQRIGVAEYDAEPWNDAEVEARFSSDLLADFQARGCEPLGIARMKLGTSDLRTLVLTTADKDAFATFTGTTARSADGELISILSDGSVIATERMPRERGAEAARERLEKMSPVDAAVEAANLDRQAKSGEAGARAMASETFRLELMPGDTPLDELWARHRDRLAEHRAGGGAEPAVHDSMDLYLAQRRAVAVQRARRIAFTVTFAELVFYATFLPGVALGVRALFASGLRIVIGLILGIVVALSLPAWWSFRAERIAIRVYRLVRGGVELDLRDAIAASEEARRHPR
jgi:hypothetical protein